MSNATNASMLAPVKLGLPFNPNTTDPSLQTLEQYLLCVWSSEGQDPDMQGYAVRLSNFVVNVCLVILIRYTSKDVAESISVLLLQIYTLLICAFISMYRKKLSVADAHFAITSTISPLSLYLLYAAIRRILRKSSYLFRRLGPNSTLIYAMLSLLVLPMWLTMDALIYFANVFSNSEKCPHINFTSWFMYRFVAATLTIGVFDVWMLAPAIAVIWVMYVLRHFGDVRKEHTRLWTDARRWERFRWVQWFPLWIKCFTKAQRNVIMESHPWLLVLFITIAYLIWSSSLVLYETHLSLFYYNLAATIQPYVKDADPLQPYQSQGHDGLDFGQLLAAAVAFPPLWQVIRLIWESRGDILQWIKGYPQSLWNGIVFLFTGYRNPWEKVLADRTANDLDSGTYNTGRMEGLDKPSMTAHSYDGKFEDATLMAYGGGYTPSLEVFGSQVNLLPLVPNRRTN